MVALSVTLTACGTVGPKPLELTGPAPDPVVRSETVEILVCPDELYRDIAGEPEPAADASVTWTDSGRDWFDAQMDRLAAALAALAGAKAACAERGAVRP